MLKKIKIQIDGIHCQSCKTLIETEVDVLEGVKDIDVDYQTGECRIEFDDQKISPKKIFETIEKLNYKPSLKSSLPSNYKVLEKEKAKRIKKSLYQKLIVGGILLILFALVYYSIEYFGLLEILSKLNEQHISYWLIFLMGFLVSFHCIGMCGGLVVTYTARHQAPNQDKKTTPLILHLQYNAGRMISYTTIGGVLGGVGSFFGINPTFTGIVTLLAGGFMILMGLSLLTHFRWLEKIKFKTPAFIARFLYSQRHTKRPKESFIIGLLNGFMPCGPLQAIQLYALASGSVIQGALSMGIYAAGTVPLMFGFGSFISLISQEKIKPVMKFSGVIVIILGLFMLNRGLINFGYGFRSFAPEKATSQTEYSTTDEIKEYQVVKMNLTYRGYSPNVLFVKKDIPVRWVINVQQMTGCTDEIIMPDYNIRKKLEYGENIIEFVPKKLGDIKFSCWMQMVWGKFVVIEGDINPEQQKLESEKTNLPQSTGNGGLSTCSCCSNIRR